MTNDHARETFVLLSAQTDARAGDEALMATTSIQWTERVWNPVTGCTKVSQGCKHCYAETIADRFWATQYPKVEFCGEQLPRARRFTDVWTHEDRLAEPLKWRKPARVFVNSMSDLFHEDVPDEFISQIFAVMALAPRHTFQILTKRADRMQDYLEEMSRRPDAYCFAWAREMEGAPSLDAETWPLPNVWLGVSVEDQGQLRRIDRLKDTVAAVRFVSFEPLLEDLGAVLLDGIHWAIIGGESGAGARPFDLAWALDLVIQCRDQGVAPFLKQVGANPMNDRGRLFLQDRKGGDPAEWPEKLRVREYPA